MKALIPFLLLLTPPALANPVCGQTVKIAVIDTGFAVINGNDLKIKLCSTGHKDFSGANTFHRSVTAIDPIPTDGHGHGTNIAGLIDKVARDSDVDYCIVVIKWFDVKHHGGGSDALVKAIRYATSIHATIANISGGGPNPVPNEKEAVKNYLDHGGILVAAAGNEGTDLAKQHYYPAEDDPRVIVVGNWDKGITHKSNYGERVNVWEMGVDQEALDIQMSGTSQAAAVHTGKLVRSYSKLCPRRISKIDKITK